MSEMAAVAEPGLLGVIGNVSTMRRMLDVFVYPDGIVVAKGSATGALLRGGGGALGLAGRQAGWAAAKAMDTARFAREAASGRQALLQLDPVNRWIASNDVVQGRLTKHRLGSRLVLTYRGGHSDKFEWKRTYNNHEAVADLLRAALGAKLAVA